MGIRIHKAMGYGLEDITPDNPIFDSKGYLNLDRESSFSEEDFINGLDTDKIELMLVAQDYEKNPFKFYDCVKYDYEDEKTSIVFIPPTQAKYWFRYDDDIDYIEETVYNQQFKNTKLIDRALYPWDWYYNTITHERLTSLQYQAYVNHKFSNYPLDEFDANAIFKNIGLPELNELDKIIPVIPDELIAMLEYLKIFKDEKDIYKLRPMIHCYWN